ncbi:MAG: phage tail protein [Erythrobacter sp.]|uniref:phage tail protein n=1 Tax=Erythrobacter sp. TaxID=1042 RepID=UPI001B1C89F6|nr:phage tail protein [Erythrobacter sp.]MBO6767073.1 phage tail protein [Erythrobacter sp.]
MATLVLGAIGTLVGGPLGGAIGATLGRGLDSVIISTPRREGPRLKELAVSTSSYGQPIPALYGTVRVPGTVIWATDLAERRETSGGGKGKPKTTTYSYSVSLAVALSSRPIDGVGRIWADGNLLRGRAGDLKTAGTLRTYTGHSDQRPDPLMAAHIGPHCPAQRGCAYVLFEDLALEDFGNRIPALSFEVFAGSASQMVAEIAQCQGIASHRVTFPELSGFVYEGGDLAGMLTLVDSLRPLDAVTSDGRIVLDGVGMPAGDIAILPQPSAWEEGEFGREDGMALTRRALPDRVPSALRYYDPSRDYQPGLQRSEGAAPASQGRVIEFPGVLTAADARGLLEQASRRIHYRSEALAWRMGELDPRLGPGRIVRAPGLSGLWRITGWEWRERGVELELIRYVPQSIAAQVADSGTAWSPPDRIAVGSSLRVFELPWDGSGAGGPPQRFAAVGAPTGRWSGASLYRLDGSALVPVGQSGPTRAVGGSLLEELGPSQGLRFESVAVARIVLEDEDSELETATVDAIARGANRLLVGNEIAQFAHAEPEGHGRWRLTGLLRGRGGTEVEALAGHMPGTPVTLIDDRLFALPADLILGIGGGLAAMGLADEEPVVAALENGGRTRRPLFPVHPGAETDGTGGLTLSWTRRARGGWRWLDEVEQPLVEQEEAYEVGLGTPHAPDRLWTVSEPRMQLNSAEISALASLYPDAPFWVRQKGSFALSTPLHLTNIPASA